MGHTEDLVDRLTNAAMEVKELLGDVRSVKKDLERTIQNCKEAKRELEEAVDQALHKGIKDQVTEHMERLGDETKEAIDQAVAKVDKEFKRLERLFLVGEDGVSLEQIIIDMGPRGKL